MADELRRESEEMGLSINLAKTKVMSNIANPGEIQVNGIEIENVSEYRYLGQITSPENKSEKEIRIR